MLNIVNKLLRFLIGDYVPIQFQKVDAKKVYVLDTGVFLTAIMDFLTWLNRGIEFAHIHGYDPYLEVTSRIFESSISRGLIVKYCTTDIARCELPPEVEGEIRKIARGPFSFIKDIYYRLLAGIKVGNKVIAVSVTHYSPNSKEDVINFLRESGFALMREKRKVVGKVLSEADVGVLTLAYEEKTKYLTNVTLITYDKYLADAGKVLGLDVIFVPGRRRELINELLENVEKAEEMKRRK